MTKVTAPTLSKPPTLDELTSGSPVALFLDFDGTLVDIAPTPDSILVPPGLARSLAALAERLEGRLAVISGRSVADLARHLDPLNVACAGSHGLERFDASGSQVGPAPRPMPDEVREALRTFAAARDGLSFEDKSFGAALHFRAQPEFEPEAVAHASEVARGAGMATKHGSCVIEVVHKDANKAQAVRAFMQLPQFRDATPVFVGDDLTDEDGFKAAADLGGFGILVGPREPTRARYHLEAPASVRDWLGLQPE